LPPCKRLGLSRASATDRVRFQPLSSNRPQLATVNRCIDATPGRKVTTPNRAAAEFFKCAQNVQQHPPSLRANGSGDRPPDDRLREAIQEPQGKSWIASPQGLLHRRHTREGVVSSTPRVLDSIAGASEYWMPACAGMTGGYTSAFSRHVAPEFCKFISALAKQRGRREDRVRAAPAVPCAKVANKTHTSIQVQRRQSGLPCAMVLQLIPCSPRRDQACLPPSPPGSVSFPRT
jgi:hypothetical protein